MQKRKNEALERTNKSSASKVTATAASNRDTDVQIRASRDAVQRSLDLLREPFQKAF